jgi:cyanate lyase
VLGVALGAQLHEKFGDERLANVDFVLNVKCRDLIPHGSGVQEIR